MSTFRKTLALLKEELRVAGVQHVAKAAEDDWIDINRNGRIEASETLSDFNGDGYVGDISDWYAFLKKNAASQLPKPLLWVSAMTPFSADNPIHRLMTIQADLVTPEELKKAYAKVGDVLQEVRRWLKDGITPQQKLKTVYDVIAVMKLSIGRTSSPLFVKNICAGRLDCDSSSFVVMAVAHELQWPVRLVLCPQHVFPRWEDKDVIVNVDNNRVSYPTDVYFTDHVFIRGAVTYESLQQGVYLASLKPSQLDSLFWATRALSLEAKNDLEAANDAYREALSFNSNAVFCWYNWGQNLSELARQHQKKSPEKSKQLMKEAQEKFTKALKLDPKDSESYEARAKCFEFFGDLQNAQQDYAKAAEYAAEHARLSQLVASKHRSSLSMSQ